MEHAEATIEALLTLATSEVGPTGREAIDLATVAEDALDAAHAAIDQRHIIIEAALEPAQTRGDRVLLERMIANLVENAVRHNEPGGWIGIRTLQLPAGAVFEVANTGASVSAERIPTLFEPFGRAEQRLDHSDGVGLGGRREAEGLVPSEHRHVGVLAVQIAQIAGVDLELFPGERRHRLDLGPQAGQIVKPISG